MISDRQTDAIASAALLYPTARATTSRSDHRSVLSTTPYNTTSDYLVLRRWHRSLRWPHIVGEQLNPKHMLRTPFLLLRHFRYA